MKIRDFHSDCKIDHSNLEGEWLEQASLYIYYAEAHSEAVFERDKAKAKLEHTHATVYNKIKTNYTDYFDSKPTEAAVKEKVVLDPHYQKSVAMLAKANRLVNDMAAAKTAMDHRKKALENLVQLKVTGLYSEPRKRTDRKGGHETRQKTLNQKRRRKG